MENKRDALSYIFVVVWISTEIFFDQNHFLIVIMLQRVCRMVCRLRIIITSRRDRRAINKCLGKYSILMALDEILNLNNMFQLSMNSGFYGPVRNGKLKRKTSISSRILDHLNPPFKMCRRNETNLIIIFIGRREIGEFWKGIAINSIGWPKIHTFLAQ